MKKTITLIGGALLSLSATAFQPIDTKAFKYIEYGYNPSLGSYSPSDIDGVAAGSADATIVSFAAKMPYKGKHQRTWFDVSYQYFETEAGVGEIGQQVQRYKAQWLHQKSRALNKQFTAWFGGGASLGFSNYVGKHTVTTDGFLDKSFDDTTGIDLGVVGSAAIEYVVPKLKRYKFGLNAQYEVPLTDSVAGFTLGAYVFYKF